MRLHTLTLTGFGPFPDTVTIDFDQLAGDGLFLIHGPTGSGKTTILDAMTFALYGKVAGARNDAGQLRSQFAAPSTQTTVVLEFSARGQRWKVTRNPAYERPAKRGNSVVLEKHGVQFARWDGQDWAGLGRTMNEVQAQIDRALQLSADQFTKIILLPQGDFAAFLRAAPQEREPILRKLFDTEHFTTVETLLANTARAARSQIATVSEHRSFVITSAVRIHDEDLPLPPVEHLSAADVDSVLGPSEAVCRDRADTATAVREAAAALLERAQAAQARAQERTAARAQLHELRRLEQQYTAGTQLRARLHEQQEQLRHAAELTPLATELTAARAVRDRCLAERHGADSRLASALVEFDAPLSERAPAELAELGRSLTAAAITIARALEDQESLRAGLAQVHTNLTAHLERVEQERSAQEAARQRIDQLRESLRTEPGELQRSQDLQQSVRTAQATLDAAYTLDRMVREYADAKQLVEYRRADEQAAREEYQAVRSRRIAGIAAELSGQLEPGAPCPVCGASEHPHPAASSGHEVTRADEVEAHEEWEARHATLTTAQHGLTRLDDQRAAARDQAAGTSADDAAEALAAVKAALAACRAGLSALAAQREEQATLEAGSGDRSARIREQEEKLGELRAQAARLEGQLAQLDRTQTGTAGAALQAVGLPVPATSHDAQNSARQGEKLTAAANACVQARDALNAAEDALLARTSAFELRLAASPFDSAEEFRAAQRIDASALERERRQQEAVATRITVLQEADWYPAASRDAVTDEALAGIAAAAQEATARALTRNQAALQHQAVAAERLQTVAGLRRSFLSELADEEAQLAELRADIALAGLVQATSPENQRRISLSSYALVALFADVAENASERLRVMSRGRYSLVHDDVLHKKEKRAGLGLQVVDAYTQEQRDPRTLSGGESFMASLALALGLADTVKATTGGVELDSLFIDEGFGSLDPDALSEVLGVLDDLRQGGRTVGVISHVQEMQQSIPNHITVRASPTGSTIRVDIAA